MKCLKFSIIALGLASLIMNLMKFFLTDGPTKEKVEKKKKDLDVKKDVKKIVDSHKDEIEAIKAEHKDKSEDEIIDEFVSNFGGKDER